MRIHTPTAVSTVLLLATGLTMVGCGSPARTVDVNREGVVNVNKANVQDFNVAVKTMLSSLYSSGALERAARKPAVVAFSRVTNDTGEYFDTDLLTVPVIEQLQESGKCVLKTTFGTDPRDKAGQEIVQRNAFINEGGVDQPDYTLIGKIFKNTTRSEDTRQATYTFQLMLTDVRTGNTAWIKQTQITKQGERSSIGL